MPVIPWFPKFSPSTSEATKEALKAAEMADDTQTLPDFILRYAPVLYLYGGEKYFPGDPVDHISHTSPRKLDGTPVSVPDEHKDKVSMLSLPDVNQPDVFLTMKLDVQKNQNSVELTSVQCKPDANGKSTSPAFILYMDKSAIVGGGGVTVDAFYFFFYPYNLGNKVVFKNFGNHVGDWEHSMVRFKDGVPQYIHCSAHSDGNAWPWALVPKKGERPIIFSAGGSHAMYPNPGTHAYSGVPIFGPKDYTSSGFLVDPVLNFVCAEVLPGIIFRRSTSSTPGHNKAINENDIITMLSYCGRWGNSFANLKKAKLFSFSLKKVTHPRRKQAAAPPEAQPKGPVDNIVVQAEAAAVQGGGDTPAALAAAQESGAKLTLYQKILVLIWSEGPTGPRDKSLDRVGMNRVDTRSVLTSL